MRRMVTDKTVIDTVNAGIKSGEIEVGGSSLPEIEEGDAGKVLKVNEAEDGVEWGEGGADNVLTLVGEGQSSTKIEITEDQYTKIQNREYHYIYIQNVADAANITLLPQTNTNRYRSTIYNISGSQIAMSGGASYIFYFFEGYCYSYSGSYYFSISKVKQEIVEYTGIRLTGTSGTLNSTDKSIISSGLILQHLTTFRVDTASQSIAAVVNWEMLDSTNSIAVGKAVLYDSTGTTPTTYKIIVNTSNGKWTATSI